MFEKVAEGIARNIYTNFFDDIVTYPEVLKAITVGVQKGAEHGYNKAKVEVEDSYRESLCNSELNLASITEQLEELNKANEWHYVKDELPPVKKEYNGRSELVLVLSKEKEMQYAQYVEKEKTWARGICEINFEPYAWKEIVLPKEK